MIEPETKDWTWVLDRPCADCGYDAAAVDPSGVGAEIRADADAWTAVLALPDVGRRPRAQTWSPLEYAAHVRDVHAVFADRVALMLDVDDPEFENWDQDRTAVDRRYDLEDAEEVAAALRANAEVVAARYDAVPAEAWSRTGRRSNDSVFSVDTLARYHLHDLHHHAWDVRAARTRAAYEQAAAAYASARTTPDPPGASGAVDRPAFTRGRRTFAAAAAAAATEGSATPRVLEIGSGAGRDARLLEAAGLSVRRTDVTAAFVELLRADGVAADVLDPLVDDLDDPRRPGVPYDGVWAAACLLHVGRDDLPVVLGRLATAARPGAPLWMTLKEGDGDGWSVHGRVLGARSFTYWREEPLRDALATSGWVVDIVEHEAGLRGERWLCTLARRRAEAVPASG